jgi:hypothetical protein
MRRRSSTSITQLHKLSRNTRVFYKNSGRSETVQAVGREGSNSQSGRPLRAAQTARSRGN